LWLGKSTYALKKTYTVLFPFDLAANSTLRNWRTRQYARLLADWIAGIGLDPKLYGTHSLRKTKATLIYRRTSLLHIRESYRAWLLPPSSPLGSSVFSVAIETMALRSLKRRSIDSLLKKAGTSK
jgi:hypothetical protein